MLAVPAALLAVFVLLDTFVWGLPLIEFHGRVIDQHGQPVSNIQLYVSGESAYMETGTRGYVTTDKDGYFFVDTRGAALILGGTQSPDHEIAYHSKRRLIENDIVAETIGSVRFLNIDSDDETLNYTRYSSREDAYIVHVWRLGEQESGAIAGRYDAKLDVDGSEYALYLNGKQKSGTGGHLKIGCKRSPMTSLRDYGDWQFSIAAVDGGLRKHADLYANLAPETGYQPEVTVVETHGSEGYRNRLYNQRYYFVTGEDKVYGSLHFDIEPHAYWSARAPDDSPCIFRLTYRINPTGSRNLEIARRVSQ